MSQQATLEHSPLQGAFLDAAPLVAGDRVRLIAASGPSPAANTAYAVELLRSWGLDPVVGSHAHEVDDRAPYLAGSDEHRRRDLVEAWTDPEAQAVICLRGGYGAMRLIDEIDWELMRESRLGPTGRPKLLTGSSDVTALHQVFARFVGVPTLFCPMPANDVFRDSEIIRSDVHRWLFEPWRGRSVSGPAAQTLVPGRATGVTEGGNLSLVAASVGAQEFAVPTGGIAVLEDIDEDLYRLDNLMIQLKRCGWFDAAAGIALGSWYNCAELSDVVALMQEYLGDLRGPSGEAVPVVSELGFGHDPNALSLPLGVIATLIAPADAQPSLVIE